MTMYTTEGVRARRSQQADFRTATSDERGRPAASGGRATPGEQTDATDDTARSLRRRLTSHVRIKPRL